MIRVQGLTKRYRDHIAISDLSFEIQKGEVVGFLGPNGAGKSTTMRILAGYMPASAGTAEIAGLDVFDHPIKVKRKVGYLPEIPPVYLDLTVDEYLLFCGRTKGLKELKMAVEKAAEQAGLSDIRKRLIRNLSKGYRQRTGLAQALLGDPELLILDEPTAGLDPIQIEQIRKLIQDLAESQKHTIILSTHILGEVRATCPRIIMVAQGQIVADAPIQELEEQHNAPLEAVFTKLAIL